MPHICSGIFSTSIASAVRIERAFILFIAIPAFCDSKAEIELRARLAAAQAQAAEALRDKAALQASLAKLNADASARSAAAVATSKTAAATATQRNAVAAQQRNAASVTADKNAAKSLNAITDNADASKAASDALKEQVAELRKDGDRGRLIQLIVACGGFVAICVPVILGALKLFGDAGVRRGEHTALMGQVALVQAEALHASALAGAAGTAVQDTKTAVAVLESEHHQSAKVQEAKLDQIHTLVNNNMTAAMEDQLEARKSSLASLQEIVALRKESGASPNPDSVAAIESIKEKIGDLEAQLSDRLKATKIATQELADKLGPAK